MRKYLILLSIVVCSLFCTESANGIKKIDPLTFEQVPSILERIKLLVNHQIPKKQLITRDSVKKYSVYSSILGKKGPLTTEKMEKLSHAYAAAVLGKDNADSKRYADMYVIEYYGAYFNYYFRALLSKRIKKLNPYKTKVIAENEKTVAESKYLEKEDILRIAKDYDDE